MQHARRTGTIGILFTLALIALGASDAFAQNQLARLRELDKNGDKAISKDEAGDKLWERLSKADADGDGKVTVAEIQAAIKANRGNGDDTPAAAQDKSTAPEGCDDTYVYKKVGDVELPLYVYKPKDLVADDKRPAIVCFHGGGWTGGAPRQFARQCAYFAQRGMVAITVKYRLTSEGVKVDDCVEDAKSAMRWVRSNAAKLGIDPDRIASCGGSAGGHLAACVQLVDTHNAPSDDTSVSAKPNAMVLFNPAMALTLDPRIDEVDEKHRAKAQALLVKRTRGQPEQISPLAFAKTKQPPCIMFFGTADALLKPADLFRQDSVAAGNTCSIVTYKDQGHSFYGRSPYYEQTLAEADRFFVELGWLPAPSN
ncbi:MAG: alpha/beta hydrolase fold domain-containing protein [Phycisphaera sp.]|nr:alpha/beta hydrolase fold domain-containing protein [Phycisphaera sp.]